MNLGPLQQLHGTPVVKDPRGIISTAVATCNGRKRFTHILVLIRELVIITTY
jgi:hypothetical protein